MAKKKQKKTETQTETPEEASVEQVEASVEETEAAEAEEAQAQEPSLEEQLAASQEETRKNWEMYLRERADLENFRKRTQRDKQDAIRFANESILRELLPALDNLERAVEHASQSDGDDQGLLQGVQMTLDQFYKAFEKFGAVPFESKGEPFDPARHQAIGQIETADQPANTVAQEMQKGYMLHDRLLRPAMVMVAKAAAEPSNTED